MRRRSLLGVLPAVALPACGYRSARPGGAVGVAVVAVEAPGGEAALIEGMVAGARRRLAAEGVSGGSAWPRLRLSLVAVGEGAAGVVERGGQVTARASGLWARGEATLEEGPENLDRWRSGEISVGAEVASADGALEAEILRRDAALRGLGIRLGEALAARFVGDGASTLDRM